MKTIIFSYWPLFNPADLGHKPGDKITNNQKTITDLLNNLQTNYDHGTAKACLWATTDNTIHPILIVDKAKLIADHLHYWSDQDIPSWFDLHIAHRPYQEMEQYAIILMPKIQQSIDRYHKARQLFHNDQITANGQYHVIFRPITFGTKHSPTFTNIKTKIPPIGTPISLSLLDSTEFDNAVQAKNIDLIDHTKIIDLGPIIRADHTKISDYLDNYLDDLEPPINSPF